MSKKYNVESLPMHPSTAAMFAELQSEAEGIDNVVGLELDPPVDANPETAALFAELREQALDMFEVAVELLPSAYCGKRNTRPLKMIAAQYEKENPFIDPRSVSVKFDKGQNVTSGTPERLAAIKEYRKQAELIPSGGEDQDAEYDFEAAYKHERKLYANELAFCGAMVQAGMMQPFTDDE